MLFRLAPVLLFASLAAHAADPELKVEKYQLGNGLTVLLSEDHRLPQVAVDVWYHVGAANQLPGKSGFAHLFEHMMFSGSRHVQPSQISALEKIGATQYNGTTSWDRTNYFEVVPASQLAAALWLEADRMGYLLDTLDEAKLKIQRDVVSNEKRQNTENRPYGMAQQRICDLLFPKPHPYYECVIGDIADIQAASLADLKAFFHQYYGPNNSVIALVGDFDSAAAKPLIEKYFGSIPRGPDVKVPDIPQPDVKQTKETFEDKLAELPQLRLVWKSVKQFTDDEPAGDILSAILGGGRTSRFYKAMTFDKQIASSVSADNSTLGIAGWFQITATAAEGHTVPELQAEVDRIVDEVKKNGVTQDEVARAQRNIIAGRMRSLERIGGFGGRADVMDEYETYLGDPGYLPRDIARYRAVTPQMVQAFAQKYLSGNRIELTIVPAKKTVGVQP